MYLQFMLQRKRLLDRQLLWLKRKRRSLNRILQAYTYCHADTARMEPQERQVSTGARVFEKVGDNVCGTVTLLTVYRNPCDVSFLTEMLAGFCTVHNARYLRRGGFVR